MPDRPALVGPLTARLALAFLTVAMGALGLLSALVLIVASLGSALYYLYHDCGRGTRMVKALAIRVALSAGLLIFLFVSYKLGWIGDTGLR